jgi:serine-type D-Ala-D-Ala carboxypeptidase/endopeptidase (penicillin-binding protein 4)
MLQASAPTVRFPRAMLLAAGAVLLLAIPALASDLAGDVRKAVSSTKLGQTKVGVSIIDVASGTSLVSVRAEEQFIPASNMKVLSSGAALLVLGADYHFKTTFTLNDDRLIVTGSGDPAFADPEVLRTMQPATTVEDILTGLVGAVAKAGVTTLREIVLDDRIFDREYVHPSWSKHHLLNAYGSETAGINFHHNIIRYFPRPSPQGPGHAPILNIEPAAPWLSITNKAETVSDSRNTLWMSRPLNSNAITVQGQIGGKQNIEKNVTIHDGATFFGRLLAHRLQAAGITVAGPTHSQPSVRLAMPEDVLSGGKTIAIVSTPITDILYRSNAHSENMYAEALLKATGNAVTKEPGSWTNGTVVIRMLLAEKIGPAAAANTIVIDGSGLSRDNRVSPQTFTSWLRVLATSSASSTFVNSLARPGEDGTLEKRFRGITLKGKLAAKSGMLNQVRTLSGYLTHPTTNRRLAFSILANDVTGDADQAVLRLHEEIINLADQWLVEAEQSTANAGTPVDAAR